ncbi:MAG: hypothetical protein PHN85_05040 [Kiritimatiellae bacterium]|nr:hypothetical protein [Kiritimatiellia bacterium]
MPLQPRTILSIACAAGVAFSASVPGLLVRGFNWNPSSGHFECCGNSCYVLLTEKLR